MSTNTSGICDNFSQIQKLQEYSKAFLANEFSLVLITSIYADLISNDKDIIAIKDSSRWSLKNIFLSAFEQFKTA